MRKLLLVAPIFALLLSAPGLDFSRSNNRRFSNNNEIITFEESDVYYDLKSDENFDFNDYPLNEKVIDDKSLKSITLIEEYGTGLYLFLYNANGKSLHEDLSSARITMSTTSNFSDTKHYPITYLDSSEDNLFYKFRIDYSYPEEISDTRYYHLSEIEFDYGEGYSSGRHNTLAQSYFYSGTGDSLSYEQKNLNVINLNVNIGSYRFDYLNSNTHGQCQHFNDLFYLTFSVDDDYGELVGIKLSWTEVNSDLHNTYYYTMGEDEISKYLPDVSFDESYTDSLIIDYTSDDLQNLSSLEDLESNVWNNFTKLVNYFHKTESEESEFKVIEKVIFDNANNSTFDSYYFNEETKTLLNNMYYDAVGGNKDIYTIRFATKDFCNQTLGDYGYEWTTHYIKTEIEDCDVLTLTFFKDGVEYSLMASSAPNDYDPGDEVPDSLDSEKAWWEKLWENILEIIAPFIQQFRQIFEYIKIGLIVAIGICGLALIIKFLKYIFG